MTGARRPEPWAPDDARWRTFVGLGLPGPVRAALIECQAAVRAAIPARASWEHEARMHLTVRFLGDVPPARIDGLSEALAGATRGAAGFSLTAAGLGVFPDARAPRVLWAGVRPSTHLAALREAVDLSLAGKGFPGDERPYSPHVTLARFREPIPRGPVLEAVRAALRDGEATRFGRFEVAEVVLFRSVPGPSGTRYEPLRTFPLAGGGGPSTDRTKDAQKDAPPLESGGTGY